MNTKFIAIFTALVMVTVTGAAVCTSDDSQASVAGGNVNISVYNGTSWTVYSGTGYNAYQAFIAANGSNVVSDGDYVKQYTNTYGSYDDINPDYGTITSVNSVANSSTSEWKVLYYNGSWNVASCTLGFISPYTDAYCASANVALYYASIATEVTSDADMISAATSGASTSANLINPSSGSDYRYSFTIKVSASNVTPTIASGTQVWVIGDSGYEQVDLTQSMLSAGVTIYGYGSNAYAALKNAVGSTNIDGDEDSATSYGWLNKLFGLESNYTAAGYVYWNQTISGNYSSFDMGYYSTITGVPDDGYTMVTSSFELEYVLYSWS